MCCSAPAAIGKMPRLPGRVIQRASEQQGRASSPVLSRSAHHRHALAVDRDPRLLEIESFHLQVTEVRRLPLHAQGQRLPLVRDDRAGGGAGLRRVVEHPNFRGSALGDLDRKVSRIQLEGSRRGSGGHRGRGGQRVIDGENGPGRHGGGHEPEVEDRQRGGRPAGRPV